MNIKHPGEVQKGHFIPDDRHAFIEAVNVYEGKRVAVSIGRERRDRTAPQNKYYWGVVIRAITDWNGDGDNPEAVHEALKEMFLALPNIRTGLRVAKSTTELSTAEFGEYVEAVKRWAAGHGVVIPDANQFE
jgi:hypothetical protein